jgi:hypothetical protein
VLYEGQINTSTAFTLLVSRYILGRPVRCAGIGYLDQRDCERQDAEGPSSVTSREGFDKQCKRRWNRIKVAHGSTWLSEWNWKSYFGLIVIENTIGNGFVNIFRYPYRDLYSSIPDLDDKTNFKIYVFSELLLPNFCFALFSLRSIKRISWRVNRIEIHSIIFQSLHYQIYFLWETDNSTMKMEATCFCETSVSACRTTRCHNSEDHSLNWWFFTFIIRHYWNQCKYIWLLHSQEPLVVRKLLIWKKFV